MDEAFVRRFWLKVDRRNDEDCWPWRAGCFHSGYGAFFWPGHRPGGAHRFSYELHVGPIPKGMVIMHKCDNRPCVNPAHLRLGTQKDNIMDAVDKGRWMSQHRWDHLRKPRNQTGKRKTGRLTPKGSIWPASGHDYWGDYAETSDRSVQLDCHHCKITWRGCATACTCPKCGAEKGYQIDNWNQCFCETCQNDKSPATG